MKISDLLRGATSELNRAGVASPEADAEQLMSYVLEITRGELVTAAFLGKEVREQDMKQFAELIARRAAREPLQHLIGATHFFGMELRVGPGVFVPRPETEYLLELLRLHSEVDPSADGFRAVDVGTGSGAIACGLQRLFPAATVVAIELDPQAVHWANLNFTVHAPDVQLEMGDFATLLADHREEFDLIVSNPPYIPADAVPIHPEVTLYDPELALYSGVDGLDAIRQLAHLAPRAIKSGGELWLEHADGQSERIVELLLAEGWSLVRAWRDLTGRHRYVSAKWN